MTDPFSVPSSGGTKADDAAYSVDDKPDAYGRYKLPHPVSGKPTAYTRATTFAKSISDTYTLSMWSQRMAAKGITIRPDLYAAVAATDLSERDKLNKLVEDAKATAGAKSGANLGTALHAFTEQLDRGEKVTAPAPWDADVEAYRIALERAGIEIVPGMIERIVLNEQFSIAGTFDRIVMWKGRPTIFDLKTGKDLEYGWNEIAIQLAIYANSEHVFDKATKTFETMPSDIDRQIGLVCHLPVGKATATIYEVDLQAGHDGAYLCAEVRNWRKRRHLATPIEVVEIEKEQSGPIRVVAERGPTVDERVASASTVLELATIRRESLVQRTWTPSVERKAIERRDAILADTAGG